MSTTLLDHREDGAETDSRPASATTPAQRLRATMAACRLMFTWFGSMKALTPEQRAVAAEAFDADGQALSATKRLVDVKHPAFRAVTAIRTKATDHWRSLSLPFPEPGIRLIKQEQVEPFARQMADYRAELDNAVRTLDDRFAELKEAARERLGVLFNDADYPETLVGLFGISWDFPSVEPPGYLMALSPQLYEQERARVAARFDEAVRLAEQSFAEEFARLVGHLTERLSGTNDDGTPKVFRDSAVENLSGFFDRFRLLNVRSDADLDALVERAQRAVRGIAPQDLRDAAGLRAHVAAQLDRVRTGLDALLVDRPRRRILRSAAAAAGEA